MALGAIAIGEAYCFPNREAVVSMSATFRKVRGRILSLGNKDQDVNKAEPIKGIVVILASKFIRGAVIVIFPDHSIEGKL